MLAILDLYKEKYPLQSYLTKREKQILDLLLEGKSNEEIAKLLNIARCTVSTHIQNVYQKFNIHDNRSCVTATKRVRLAMAYLTTMEPQ